MMNSNKSKDKENKYIQLQFDFDNDGEIIDYMPEVEEEEKING